ncbi:MAG: hypothetical protein KAT62_12890 [Desulfuromonadales bacterium]|nr:hypothetical protein [Desulfuromonadales bacterium]
MKLKIKLSFTRLMRVDIGQKFQRFPAVCATQGENLQELIANIYDAVEGCLSIDMDDIKREKTDSVMKLAI